MRSIFWVVIRLWIRKFKFWIGFLIDFYGSYIVSGYIGDGYWVCIFSCVECKCVLFWFYFNLKLNL